MLAGQRAMIEAIKTARLSGKKFVQDLKWDEAQKKSILSGERGDDLWKKSWAVQMNLKKKKKKNEYFYKICHFVIS